MGFSPRNFFGGEDRFDSAAIRPAANQSAIGPFPEHKVECADDDRFAGARFAGDGVVAGLKLDGEVIDQGEIFDAERQQHLTVR